MSKVNIYCSGGAASNIGKHFIKYSNQKSSGFAELNTFFIDASRSNIGNDIPEEITYIVDGLDGSGKRRDSNYKPLVECHKEILHKFRPADLNIVLHSASGGKATYVANAR